MKGGTASNVEPPPLIYRVQSMLAPSVPMPSMADFPMEKKKLGEAAGRLPQIFHPLSTFSTLSGRRLTKTPSFSEVSQSRPAHGSRASRMTFLCFCHELDLAVQILHFSMIEISPNILRWDIAWPRAAFRPSPGKIQILTDSLPRCPCWVRESATRLAFSIGMRPPSI